MRVACVLIVSQKRVPLVHTRVLPSVLAAGFAEVVWVGDGAPGEGYRFLHIPKMTGTTTDALVKRDVGTLATTSEWLLYLCDDHAVRQFALPAGDYDVVVPWRVTQHPEQGEVRLNMGMDPADPHFPYCGGHAGLFRRSLVQARPWTTMPHDRLWDLLASREQLAMGARFAESPTIVVEDLEPEAAPWR